MGTGSAPFFLMARASLSMTPSIFQARACVSDKGVIRVSKQVVLLSPQWQYSQKHPKIIQNLSQKLSTCGPKVSKKSPWGCLGAPLSDPKVTKKSPWGTLGAPWATLEGFWGVWGSPGGGLGVILEPFWEHFGVQNGAKKRQKSDPESGHFPDQFLQWFWHPRTLIFELFVWRVCKNHTFHIFVLWTVFGTILSSK